MMNTRIRWYQMFQEGYITHSPTHLRFISENLGVLFVNHESLRLAEGVYPLIRIIY